MKTFRRKLPAVAVAISLLWLALPAWPGGRDVPDRESAGHKKSEQPQPGQDLPLVRPCDEATVVTTVTVGGVSLELAWSPDGSFRLVPSLWSRAASLLRAASDGGSCSER